MQRLTAIYIIHSLLEVSGLLGAPPPLKVIIFYFTTAVVSLKRMLRDILLYNGSYLLFVHEYQLLLYIFVHYVLVRVHISVPIVQVHLLQFVQG